MGTDREAREVAPGPGSIEEAIMAELAATDRDERQEAIDDASRAVDPDQLVDAMAEPADSVRRNAAISALTRAGARGVPALVRALHHDDPEVAMFAAGILGKTRDRAAIPHLIELVEHDEINIAQAAIESLGRLRATEAVSSLSAALEQDGWLRYAAIYALGEIGDPRSAEILTPMLADPELRELVIEALGKVRSATSVEYLSRLLRETSDEAGFAICLRALAELVELEPASTLDQAPSWCELATPATSEVHVRLLSLLAADDARVTAMTSDEELKEAAAILIRLLHLRSLYTPLVLVARKPALYDVVAYSVISIGTEITDALRVGMAYEHANARRLACHCAGALRLESLAGEVIERCGDSDPDVRCAALTALVRIRGDKVAERIATALGDDTPEVVDVARELLTTLDPELVTKALLRRGVRDAHDKLDLLDIARANPHPSQRSIIERCLDDDDAEVRCAAVRALAAQPSTDVDSLRALIDDRDRSVREEVIETLATTRSRRVKLLLLHRLDQDPEARATIVRALARTRDAHFAPRFIHAFDSEPATVRLAIIESLAELRDPAAEPLLVRVLADDDEEIRRTTIDALRELASPLVVRHLLVAVRDPCWEVRRAAADAFASFATPTAVRGLELLALDEDTRVAAVARTHLEAMGA